MEIDIRKLTAQIKENLTVLEQVHGDRAAWNLFCSDMRRRMCWNSNAIEGNTLSLDETVALIDYDEVRNGHTYSEYMDAKNMYTAVREYISFEQAQEITINWITAVHTALFGCNTGFRQKNVYIGTIAEVAYQPPQFQRIPELMEEYLLQVNVRETCPEECVRQLAQKHIQFERIHPFIDGNGRTGRCILNQLLLNNGFPPAMIMDKSKYRQAFRQYDKNGATELMEYVIWKGIQYSLEVAKSITDGQADMNRV